jgi:predicted nucleotidyltransferase
MSIFDAAVEVAAFLEDKQIPYAVLGGLALQHWGDPRTTQDVDIVVMVSSEKEEKFLKTMLRRFRPRMADALSFAKRHRILLISTADGIPVDLSLGIPGYEEQAMRRVSKVSFTGLSPIRVVSAEDLIIHKCVAGRARDTEDIERILIRQKVKLDLRYVRRWLQAFAPIVEAHDVRGLFENAVKKARGLLRRESRR